MRDWIVKFLKDEIIGPAPVAPHVQRNGEEVLINDSPRMRYGAGVLFPTGVSIETAEDGNDQDAAGVDAEVEREDDGEDDVVELEIGRPSSSHDNGEDQTAEEITSLTNAHLPSALGFSCLSILPETGFEVEVKAARYRSEPHEYMIKSGQIKKGTKYMRVPFASVLKVPSAELAGDGLEIWKGRPETVDGEVLPLEIQILSRPQFSEDGEPVRRLLTLALINRQVSDSGYGDTAKCFFQVELKLRADDGSASFLEYPSQIGEALDDEERSLRLLYRHRKTYAIGHGCAAGWNETLGLGVDTVFSDIIPCYEVKPVLPASFDDLQLCMFELSNHGNNDAIDSVLSTLCDKYEAWVMQEQETVESSDFPQEFYETAHRHLDNCKECLKRMRSGVKLLQADPTVRKAFRLSNYAMLLQQLHYGMNLRPWISEGADGPCVDPVCWPNPNSPPEGLGQWRPFQIAFILMNLRSIAIPDDEERDIVDLIWFPTGGGKTEAYLGLTAFTIFFRRLINAKDAGTAILMRYTLRLLTAQQFQRSASLICACERIRCDIPDELGEDRITIGLWVGRSLTPNKRADAVQALKKLSRGEVRDNPFLVLQCPWCGAQMGPVRIGNRNRVFGYQHVRRPSTVKLKCPDSACDFHDALPLLVIDEEIYETPPTLIIGTVDKFALLPWFAEARVLFGIGTERDLSPPSLIIQDELHLISGPLGSMVGHYETVIDALCTKGGEHTVRPKIVASTATISRAKEQVQAIYARDVCLFPPQCLRAGDSFFAKEEVEKPGRLYMGIHASALPSHVTAQVRVIASLLQAPMSKEGNENERDRYWTVVQYFNSLRELGHAATLVSADIREYLGAMWLRKNIKKTDESDPRRFINHAIELTSRVASNDIPESLQKLEVCYTADKTTWPVDTCLASNMISVGIDVSRLGLMVVIGQPKTTSEYIQATSRVGRRDPGLVVALYNTGKPRDRSHYEHFRSFHTSIYRQVEPTSVTPFAAPVRERALHALLIALTRYWGKTGERERPQPFPDDQLIQRIRSVIKERILAVDPNELDLTMQYFDNLLDDWERIQPSIYGGFGPPVEDVPLMYPAGSEPLPDWVGRSWATPSSMRNVDASCEAEVIRQYIDEDEFEAMEETQ